MKKHMKLIQAIGALALTVPLLVQASTAVEFVTVTGDRADCPAGFDRTSAVVALNYKDFACRAIGTQGGARLQDERAMSGASGGCNVYNVPVTVKVPATLCHKAGFTKVEGDNQCPQGKRLATVAEAALLNAQACTALSDWDIARLAGKGSIGGSRYNCIVRSEDANGMGHSLCVDAESNAK